MFGLGVGDLFDPGHHRPADSERVQDRAEPGADYLQTATIIDLIERDSTVVQVEQIGPRVGMSTRNVQRLFKFYLGVPPKWVLMRSRLQDAAAGRP